MCVMEALLLTKNNNEGNRCPANIQDLSFQKEPQPYATISNHLHKYELQKTLTEDDLNDFPLLGLSREAEDRKTSISKAAAPSGAQSKVYCDRGGMEGDRVCVGVISWMKGHEHYSDLCIIGVLDFLFTLLFLSTVVFQVCWQKKSN